MKIKSGIINTKKIKDLFIYGFGQAINLLSPLIVMPYLIAVCGEEGLGKIGVGFSLALILCGIVDYGSYIKGVKDISINRHDRAFVRSRLEAIYLSKFILLLIVLGLSALMIEFIPFFAREKTMFFLSLSIVVGQFLNPAWYFQATENFKWISAINIISKVIYVVAVFTLITERGDYIFANLFFGAGAIIANFAGFIVVVRKYRLSISDFPLKPAVDILKNEFSFTVSQFFLSVYQFFPIMIISYIGGDYMAGQYRVIDQIISIFKSYLNIFFYFVYANVCYEIDKSLKKGLAVWKLYNGLNFLLIFGMIVVFFIGAEPIFMYFKLDPSQIEPVAHYFRIGLAVPLLIAISQPLRQLMFAFDKNKIYITITIVATIVNIILLAWLTGSLGLKGALLSMAAVEVAIIALYIFVLNPIFKAPHENPVNT